MTPSGIPKVDFATAFNRVLTQTRAPYGHGPKMTIRSFQSLMKISSIHITHIRYKALEKFRPLVK